MSVCSVHLSVDTTPAPLSFERTGMEQVALQPVCARPVDDPCLAVYARCLQVMQSALPLGFDWTGGGHDAANRPLIALDSETGGLEAGRDALLSISAAGVHQLGGRTMHRHVIPEPGLRLDPAAERTHGLTRERLRALGAQPERQALADLADFLQEAGGGRPVAVAAYSAAFDRDMLAAACARQGVRLPIAAWYDLRPTTQVLRRVLPGADAALPQRNTLEAFHQIVCGTRPVRGLHQADEDISILLAGVRVLCHHRLPVARLDDHDATRIAA